ncbi:MAG: hypothetical protein L0Y58_08360 [Verrucomicrobia subdivision 3 bacterium]|nr:hypothetical protein [Limisphaerales bacterium]
MHSQDTINQFIALRAKGRALGAIAEQLGMGFGTAWKWAAKYKNEIERLRALEIELIQERVLAGYEQELTHLAEELKRVQAELRGRDYGYVNTEQLYWYQNQLLARIDKKRTPPVSPADEPESPEGEPSPKSDEK